MQAEIRKEVTGACVFVSKRAERVLTGLLVAICCLKNNHDPGDDCCGIANGKERVDNQQSTPPFTNKSLL